MEWLPGRGRGRGRGGPGQSEVLLGGYDPARRREEVRNRLYHSFDYIRKEDLHKKVTAVDSLACQLSKSSGSGPGGWTMSGFFGEFGGNQAKVVPQKDSLSMSLELILSHVETLADNVEKFQGPHFTKIYRTLQGDCTKLQSDLDRLEVTGRDDIRKQRRDALLWIDALAKELAKKTHRDGKSCGDCEVRE